ncbi:MAG TPA: DUF192 domain-containing protein [Sphingobium sp.]|uniref:DUF192 domain-containing protein n=1 Tax=Sphingobium sp. TaxID=1912891 RepID=UPI002ED44FF5
MRILPLLPLAAALALSACKATPPPQNEGADAGGNSAGAVVTTSVPLRITTTGGIQTLSMELAITEEEQEKGLMNRPPLPQGRGMLFPFSLPHIASFWMKNTPAPLDLLFVRPDGTVAAVLHGKPNDLTPLSAGEPVSAVVEIGAGEAERMGIAPKDRIEWGDCSGGRRQPGDPLNPFAFCPAG